MTEITTEKGIYYSKISAIFGAVSMSLIGDLFLTGYAVFLGLSNYQIGLLSTFAITSNIASLLSLWFVERLNIRKKLIIISITLAYLFFSPIIFLPFIDFLEIRIVILILLAMTFNFFMAIVYPAFNSWLVDLVSEKIRGRYFGIRNLLAGIAGVIFILIGGKFLDMYPKNSPYGFIILFSTAIIFGFLNAVIINKIPEIKPHKDISAGVKIDFMGLIKIPFSNKNFINLIIFRCFLHFSAVLGGGFINLYLLKELNLNYSTVALFGITGNIFLFVPQKWWGVVADKLSSRPIIYIGLTGITLLPLILAITKSVPYYFIAVVLCSIGWSAVSIAEMKILFNVAKGEHSISYISIFTILMSLTQALATLSASVIISFISFKILFFISFFLRAMSFLFVNKISEPEKGDVVSAVVIFRKAVISDVLEGVHHLIHYISIPVETISKRKVHK